MNQLDFYSYSNKFADKANNHLGTYNLSQETMWKMAGDWNKIAVQTLIEHINENTGCIQGIWYNNRTYTDSTELLQKIADDLEAPESALKLLIDLETRMRAVKTKESIINEVKSEIDNYFSYKIQKIKEKVKEELVLEINADIKSKEAHLNHLISSLKNIKSEIVIEAVNCSDEDIDGINSKLKELIE